MVGKHFGSSRKRRSKYVIVIYFVSRILFLNVWENILSFKENIVWSQILERADGCCPQRCAPLRPKFTLPANRICTNFSDLFNSELEKWFCSWELWFLNYGLSFFSRIVLFWIFWIFHFYSNLKSKPMLPSQYSR